MILGLINKFLLYILIENDEKKLVFICKKVRNTQEKPSFTESFTCYIII